MGITQFGGALILFTLAQIGFVAGQVIMFRGDNKALRREVEAARAADREVVQLKLDALALAIARIDRQVTEIARLVAGDRRPARLYNTTE